MPRLADPATTSLRAAFLGAGRAVTGVRQPRPSWRSWWSPAASASWRKVAVPTTAAESRAVIQGRSPEATAAPMPNEVPDGGALGPVLREENQFGSRPRAREPRRSGRPRDRERGRGRAGARRAAGPVEDHPRRAYRRRRAERRVRAERDGRGSHRREQRRDRAQLLHRGRSCGHLHAPDPREAVRPGDGTAARHSAP